jgi:hypothetical protein
MDKYYTVRFLDLRQEVTVLANTRRWAIDEAAKIFYDSGIVPRPPHWRPVELVFGRVRTLRPTTATPAPDARFPRPLAASARPERGSPTKRRFDSDAAPQ